MASLARMFRRSRKKASKSAESKSGTEEDEKTEFLDEVAKEIDSGLEGAYKKEVDDYLMTERRKCSGGITVLLIGPGESGKTTFMKQIARIHRGRVSKDELLFHRETIRHNIVEGMLILCEQSQELGGDYAVAPEHEEHRHDVLLLNELLAASRVTDLVDISLQSKMDVLWDDAGIQKAYHLRHTFETRQLPYHFAYLMSRSSAIWTPRYLPSYDDYVKVRVRSTGVREEVFWSASSKCSSGTKPTVASAVPFKFVDVGGQRSERRKWMRVFDAEAALYVFGIGDYNLTCFEDGETKRLDEAMCLFEELCATTVDRVCHRKFFDDKSLIVFFNKWDVLNTKLRAGVHKFSDAFVDDDSVDESRQSDPQYIYDFMCAKMKVILDKYKPRLTDSEVHFHKTRATSMKNAQKVMRAVQRDILQWKLETVKKPLV